MPLAINPACDRYLDERLGLLEKQLLKVNKMALADKLPDAFITESGLKITPLDLNVPDAAQQLIDKTSGLLPQVKITELLLDVDDWTRFSRHFTHLKMVNTPKKRPCC